MHAKGFFDGRGRYRSRDLVMQNADPKRLPKGSRRREKSTFLGDAVIHGFVVRNPTLEVSSRRGHLNS